MKNCFYNNAKTYRLIVVLLMIVTIFSSKTFAQKWLTYSIPHGLAGKNVNDMLVDQNGQIWIATENGVNRFNGKWLILQKENGLIDNYVSIIVPDSDGMIWFGTGLENDGTTNGGISKIDPASDLRDVANWHSYNTDSTHNGLSSNKITSILFDSEGKIWFGTFGGGISIVDPSPDINKPFQDPLKDPDNWVTLTKKDGLGSDVVKVMYMDAMGNIWVATSDYINIFELESRKWTTFRLELDDDKHTNVIFKDRKGNIWIGAKHGVYKVFPNNLSVYDEHYTEADGMADNSVLAIAQDIEGALWFGHGGYGVSMAMPESDLKDPTNWQKFTVIDGLTSNTVTSIIEDQEENVWFGHLEEEGVSQLDRSWLSFLTQRGTETNFINGLFTIDQRTLWMATKGGVVKVGLDANLLLEKNLSDTLTVSNNGLKESNVSVIFQDSQSFLWFGASRGAYRVAVEVVNDSSKWVFYNPDPYPTIVNWILEDRLGYIWLARGKGRGLNRVHIDSIAIDSSWMTITKADGLAADEVFIILSDKNGNLWFGADNGVSVFNPTLNPKIAKNWTNYDTIKRLKMVRSIYEDFNSNIWFATQGSGVIKIDPTTDLGDSSNWKSYTTGDGLASNFVTSITQLKENEIWFGTAIGASKYEMNNPINKWTTYTKSSGLLSNFITSLFADQTKNDIWFGTSGGGVTRYRRKPKPPETFLDPKYDIVTDNLVTFKFHGKDIITPAEDLRFWYTLDFKDTIETSDNFATIFIENSDKPERHVFQVMAIDNDGNTDPTPATDEFYIIDPQYGSNVEITDSDTPGVRLFIPPAVLATGNSLTIKSLKRYELPDTSNVVLAYQIVGHPEEFVSLNKPATLAISFLNSASYNRNELAIYRLNNSKTWDVIGGTIKTRFDTVTITTSITELGIYAVRNQTASKLEKPTDEITIQPRIFSPGGGGQGHGDHANISFFLKDNSDVTVKIYNIAGRLKKLLTENEPMLPGMNAIVWDGKDDDGNYCVTGLYLVTVETDWDMKKKKVMVLNKYR